MRRIDPPEIEAKYPQALTWFDLTCRDFYDPPIGGFVGRTVRFYERAVDAHVNGATRRRVELVAVADAPAVAPISPAPAAVASKFLKRFAQQTIHWIPFDHEVTREQQARAEAICAPIGVWSRVGAEGTIRYSRWREMRDYPVAPSSASPPRWDPALARICVGPDVHVLRLYGSTGRDLSKPRPLLVEVPMYRAAPPTTRMRGSNVAIADGRPERFVYSQDDDTLLEGSTSELRLSNRTIRADQVVTLSLDAGFF